MNGNINESTISLRACDMTQKDSVEIEINKSDSKENKQAFSSRLNCLLDKIHPTDKWNKSLARTDRNNCSVPFLLMQLKAID